MDTNSVSRWFNNGYLLKAEGMFILLIDWLLLAYAIILRLNGIGNVPDWVYFIWFMLSYTPLMLIFGWHIGTAQIAGQTIPIVTGEATHDH